MSKRLLTSEKIALMLSKSRTAKSVSQKHMAKCLGKSVSTIQNWENGYSTPNVIDILDWFDELGINPLHYFLEFMNESSLTSLSCDTDEEAIDASLKYYLKEIAPISDKKKLAFCIFGGSGSSWSAQLDMLTAHNHTSIRSRVCAGQTIYDSYMIEKARNELSFKDSIMPDEENFKSALTKCKVAAYDGKDGYSNA